MFQITTSSSYTAGRWWLSWPELEDLATGGRPEDVAAQKLIKRAGGVVNEVENEEAPRRRRRPPRLLVLFLISSRHLPNESASSSMSSLLMIPFSSSPRRRPLCSLLSLSPTRLQNSTFDTFDMYFTKVKGDFDPSGNLRFVSN
ncbi:hypothetical protein QVD17_04464 [Tagetes erecta]|uniref:Uncharacterized protein n=1 Tax=Tagetes erecta TaxID=13708 RepID=A0AAD8LJL5_TARER|nr:hypothetical protein QVD17_04464 [Tagetes erecta]